MLVPEKSITALVGISDRSEEAFRGQNVARCNKQIAFRSAPEEEERALSQRNHHPGDEASAALYLDGGMGTMLQARGLAGGLLPETGDGELEWRQGSTGLLGSRLA